VKSSRVIKLAAIICFALTISILMVIRNSPATGYEASIYTHTPPIVWVVLILSIISGIGIILHQLYTREEETSNLWVIGLLLVATSLTVVFLAGALKGYTLYGMDSLAHTGKVRDIISSGHFEQRNFYPMLHIYIAQLSQTWGINHLKLFGYIPAFYALLFIIFMYVFTRSILTEKGQAILATIMGCFVLTAGSTGQVFTSPNSQADMLLPMIFFIYIRSLGLKTFKNKNKFRLLLIMMIFLVVPFHPVATLPVLIMMLTMWLPVALYNIWSRKDGQSIPNSYQFSLITPATLLLFIWFITWLSSFYIFESTVNNIYNVIIESGPGHISALVDELVFASQYGYNIWEQFAIRYGDSLVIIILALIAFPMLLRKLRVNIDEGRLFSLYGPLVVTALAMITLFGFNLQFGPFRLLRYLLIFCSLFAGFVLYELILTERRALKKSYLVRVCLSLIAIILILLPINATFKTYYSRYTKTPSGHVPSAAIEGMAWFFSNKEVSVYSTSNALSPFRYAELILTPEEIKKRFDIPGTKYPLIPWHFNYDKQTMLGASYAEDIYMIVTEADRVVYVETYPEIARLRFYPGDFDRLEDDPSIDNLYDNGGLDVWYVRPVIHLP